MKTPILEILLILTQSHPYDISISIHPLHICLSVRAAGELDRIQVNLGKEEEYTLGMSINIIHTYSQTNKHIFLNLFMRSVCHTCSCGTTIETILS